MMSGFVYWKRPAGAIKWGLLVGLCIAFLSGCGQDKALSFTWQEETAGSDGVEGGAAESAVKNLSENAAESGASGADSEEGVSVPHVEAQSGVSTDTENPALLYVHVCGAVVEPGVVELPQGSRAEDALLAAGGFREDASTDYVNLASQVEDGQQLYFPTLAEAETLRTEAKAMDEEQLLQESGKVNINTADRELLCTLPGIGEARAQDIITYRQEHGNFETVEDIMKVPGIKQSAYGKLCDKITVN